MFKKLGKLFCTSSKSTFEPSSMRKAVCDAYSAAAAEPGASHPFPVGRWFAESVGYEPRLLDELPEDSVNSFAGVSNLAQWADIPEGSVVLDIGCGAGLDALIAARKTGPDGRVIGLDFSQAMIVRARAAAEVDGRSNVEFIRGDAENISLETGSVDIVLANGIFNLNPQREKIFCEIYRVLKDEGTAYVSELILKDPRKDDAVCDLKNWFA